MINQLSTRHARISLWKVAAVLLISNHEDLFSIYIASCILNQSPVLYNHSLEHCSYIHSIRKTSFPQTIKTLLVSLALSNVGVGLIVQPFYTQLCQLPGLYCNRCFFISSLFLGVVANSADRFLVIHIHLWYQELVAHKRVVLAITVWLLSPFLSLFVFLPDIHFVFLSSRNSVVLRRHENQIHAMQEGQVTQDCRSEF